MKILTVEKCIRERLKTSHRIISSLFITTLGKVVIQPMSEDRSNLFILSLAKNRPTLLN